MAATARCARLKDPSPFAIYSIGILLKKKGFKSEAMANMVSILIGVGIAAYGEAKFDSLGVILQLDAIAFEATRLVMIQILLTFKGITLNPITSLYYVAPCCLVFLFFPWIFVEFPVLKEQSSFHFDYVIFGSNSLCAFRRKAMEDGAAICGDSSYTNFGYSYI